MHVGIGSKAEGVGVLDRIRAWLPTVLAPLGRNGTGVAARAPAIRERGRPYLRSVRASLCCSA
ncbi:hypothetical protein [Arthrobacter sp. MDT1-65]